MESNDMQKKCMKFNVVRLSPKVKVRQEHFGGLIFNMDTGDVIDIDREAFIVISMIRDIQVVDVNALLNMPITYKGKPIDSESIKGVLQKFADIGIIDVMPNGVLSEDYKRLLEEKSRIELRWPEYQHLSAPETIHWAVTYRCEEACLDCYIQRHKGSCTNELDTQEAYKLISKIAESGAFQLAIGGGEPFVRNDLEEIVQRASEEGLIVHITTGKYRIELERLDELAGHIKVLQVGIKVDELIKGDTNSVQKLRTLVGQLSERGIMTGANLIMTRSSIHNLYKIIEMLLQCGFNRYTLLRYKPPINIGRWLVEKPDKGDIELLEARLAGINDKYTDISIRIDCALSFVERKLDPQVALFSGVRGCAAFQRIMFVAPDGSVYPCSQLVGDRFNGCNLLKEEFGTIWDKSDVVKNYRYFRSNKSFKEGSCGKCKAKVFCGGCRVFADDAIGSDPGCPEYVEETKGWLEANNKDYPSWIYKWRVLNEDNKY